MAVKDINNVTDIIDLEYLQTIQDSLGRIVGITTALLDPNGVPISQPTNLKAFCAMMQASEAGVTMCVRANGSLIAENKRTRQPAVITCPNSGLKTASVPFFLGDQFLGSWLIGQIRMDYIDFDLIERTAEQAGISKEAAKRNIAMLPVITQEEFDNILNFLTTVTSALTEMVEVNAALIDQNESLVDMTQKLDNSLRVFREFIDITDVGTYLVDYFTGELIVSNDVYKTAFAARAKSAVAGRCYELMGFDDFCSFCPKEKLLDEQGEPTGAYTWENFNEANGQWLRITSRALHWVDNRLAIMTTFLDITDRKKEEERVAYLAYHDQGLNIFNGIKLFEDVNACHGVDATLVCFDVRSLREINNVYGRTAGDKLLRGIVDWVEGQLPEEGTIYRVQSDDFVVLLQGLERSEGERLLKRLYSRFDEAWTLEMDGISQQMFTGVNMGMMAVEQSYDTYAALLNVIEQVLTFARREGQFIVFDAIMQAQYEAEMLLQFNLKRCVLNGMEGFSLHYQPIVDAVSGRWQGLEALCRWHSPQVGNVPPDIFIHVAEKLGLIDIISEWVLNESLRQIKVWKLDELPKFSLDVNLSPVELRSHGLLPRVLGALERHQYPPKKLSLEITESAEVHFDEKTLTFLREIRAIGVSLSLDDFGIGYANFSNLKSLPVHMLKTDRSFVIGIEDDPFLQHTLRIMIDFAQAASLVVVAEGVETEEQCRIVERSGANLIQGYYFSKPLPAQELEKNLYRFQR